MYQRWTAACLSTLAELAVADDPVYVRRAAPYLDATQIAKMIGRMSDEP
jgi:hypothetical protein